MRCKIGFIRIESKYKIAMFVLRPKLLFGTELIRKTLFCNEREFQYQCLAKQSFASRTLNNHFTSTIFLLSTKSPVFRT